MLIIRDVRDTMMILYMICQLVCVTDSWAHMSLVHLILSLKLGVTAAAPGRAAAHACARVGRRSTWIPGQRRPAHAAAA